MGFYDRLIAPRLIGAACGLAPVQAYRRRIVPKAHGVVVELGIGSGHNLPFYDRARVERLVAVNPADGFLRRDAIEAGANDLAIEFVEHSAEDLPLPDGFADSVVVTYTLCSIADVKAALSEARRILKPDGHLLFCEHGRSTTLSTARLQERLTPYWRPLACGCRLDRDPVSLLERAGFDIHCLEQGRMRGVPAVIGFHHLGVAAPRGTAAAG